MTEFTPLWDLSDYDSLEADTPWEAKDNGDVVYLIGFTDEICEPYDYVARGSLSESDHVRYTYSTTHPVHIHEMPIRRFLYWFRPL